MKKLLSCFSLVLLGFSLGGCVLKQKPVEADKDPVGKISKTTQQSILKNKWQWNSQLADATIMHVNYDNPLDFSLVPTTLSEWKKYNSLLVHGTVYNLEKMTGDVDDAHTKVTILVQKTINGDQKLQDHLIKFSLNSGFINQPTDKKFKYKIRDQIPLPHIGSEIIVSLTPHTIDPQGKDEFNQFYIKNNLADQRSFVVQKPSANIWVRDAGESLFRPNNPKLNADQKDDWYSSKILALTDQINQSLFSQSKNH